MSLERVYLKNGSVLLLEPAMANKVRARLAERAKQADRISRELRSLGPRQWRNSLASKSGQSHYDRSQDRELETPRSPKELQAERAEKRKASIETRWKTLIS